MPNVHYSSAEKLAVLMEMESSQFGIMAAVKKFGIPKQSLAKWRHLYELYGLEGLEPQTRKQYQVIDKYKIASRTQLSDWVKKYNSHSSLHRNPGRAKAMIKGRSTT